MKKRTEGVSIIIPTYQEANNLSELVFDIANSNLGQFEVIIVDDQSHDGTRQIIHDLQIIYPWLKLIERHVPRSLSQSVLEGFERAQYNLLVKMDADHSHSPKQIFLLLDALSHHNTDLVVGSRYVNQGQIDDAWPLSRKIISLIARKLAQGLLNIRIADPLSGFFAVKKNILSTISLSPIGWQIGLELIVKCRKDRITEVPITFYQRKKGKSKLNLKIVMLYLQHVRQLLLYKRVKN